MRYWLRELGGWALVLIGLIFCYLAFELTVRNKILNAWPVALMGIFVFRGGIHLLKVAMAARVCQQAQERLYPVAAGTRRRGRRVTGVRNKSSVAAKTKRRQSRGSSSSTQANS